MVSKKILAFVCGFFLVSTGAAAVEQGLVQTTRHIVPHREMAFNMNALSALMLKADVKYLVRVHSHIAITIPVVVQFPLPAAMGMWWPFQAFDNMSVNAGLGAKFYALGEALQKGLYMEPYFLLGYAKHRVYDWDMNPTRITNCDYVVLRPGLLAGYSWVLSSGFTADVGAGLQYDHGFAVGKNFASAEAYRNWRPTFETAFGYAW